jgi:hypothetical protein
MKCESALCFWDESSPYTKCKEYYKADCNQLTVETCLFGIKCGIDYTCIKDLNKAWECPKGEEDECVKHLSAECSSLDVTNCPNGNQCFLEKKGCISSLKSTVDC